MAEWGVFGVDSLWGVFGVDSLYFTGGSYNSSSFGRVSMACSKFDSFLI